MKKPYSQAAEHIAQLKAIELLINKMQLQQAAQQLTRLTATAGHDPRLFLLGSRLAEAAGNPDGTLAAARKAHQLAPEWPTAAVYLAGVLASRDEAEEAMALAGKSLQGSNDAALLIQAAAVAQRVSQFGQSLQWLQLAEKITPTDVALKHQIARTLADSGDHAGAIAIFTELLQKKPNSPVVLMDRLRVYLTAEKNEQAILDAEALLAMEPDNAVYHFYLDRARGLTPPTQPAALVADLFDGFAQRYDRYWAVQLHYKLPRDVAQMIKEWHPDRQGDVLDLGCGTGLMGACLGPIEGVLVGVDLSGQMIAQAGRHHVYDGFHQVNLLDALEATPENLYHVITALDVLNYVGNLDSVIPNAHRILLPGGRFVFSCETSATEEADYTLSGTYRYTHQRGYVQRLLEEAGFKNVVIEDRVLRYEAELPVQGFLVTAQKQLAAEKKSARKRVPKSG
ncbi:MAG: methyltransferase domain-containing protein [Rhodoferax sp.]|nr:methyltransferase domain-containing protein [Rhodoferax sp.]